MVTRLEMWFDRYRDAQRIADQIDRAGWETSMDGQSGTDEGVIVRVHLRPGDDAAGVLAAVSEVLAE